MFDKILLVPGLNGKFDSEVFEFCKNYSKKRFIEVIEMDFSKYKGDKYNSTFNEQLRELEERITKTGGVVIVISKSLGCVPTILLKKPIKKILFSPTISLGEEEKEIFDKPFKDLDTSPIVINKNRFKKEDSIIYGSKDERIAVKDLKSLKDVRNFEIGSQDHKLGGLFLKKIIEGELEYHARKI